MKSASWLTDKPYFFEAGEMNRDPHDETNLGRRQALQRDD
jgi:hypothetical protein